MKKIKNPSVAGRFYPNNTDELLNLFKQYENDIKIDSNYISQLVISPHAGYIYSARCAYQALKHIKGENIFIFSPAHKVYVNTAAICDYDSFLTPLGEVELNKDIISELQVEINNIAFEDEHAIEVQLPILQYLHKNFKIIPVIVGQNGTSVVNNIISKYWNDKSCSFVISSDLSHYMSDTQAKKLDEISAYMIESNDYRKFHPQQACGAASIIGALKFAQEKNYSFIRLDMRNSSSAANDKSRVVGYGSWLLYEGEKNTYIAKYFGNLLKEIAYNSIKSKGNVTLENYPCVLNQFGASFVTLQKNNKLRGCIGSSYAHRPLIADLIHNAYLSAYSDTRFNPLNESELSEIDIKISLLSEPYEIHFSSEEDLLDKIIPCKDGLIIQDGQYRALYLPSVWEQLSDKKLFLYSLKQKAGLEPTYFSKTFKAWKFHSEYI